MNPSHLIFGERNAFLLLGRGPLHIREFAMGCPGRGNDSPCDPKPARELVIQTPRVLAGGHDQPRKESEVGWRCGITS